MKIQKPCWPDNAYYFITTSTFLHFPYFIYDDQKQIVLDRLREMEIKLNIEIKAFSIAMNHFHYVTFLQKGELYSKIKQFMNGGISCLYGKRFSKKYKQMWQGTKAIIINNEKSYWMILGYIIGNLLKHRRVSTFQELYNNKYSSYKSFVDEHDEEFARELVYRVINVEEDSEASVDVKSFEKIGIQDMLNGLKPTNPG